jgi:DUF1680 family protein
MKDEEGPIACLFGPCEAEIMMGNNDITIKEITSYPYDFSVSFEITANDPVNFALKIRKPAWTNSVKLNVPFTEETGFIRIKKEWKGMERVTIEFEPIITINTSFDNEVYFSYGPLVLAHPIEAIETKTKEYGIKDMFDTHYKPVKLDEYLYHGGNVAKKEGTLNFEVDMLSKQSGMHEKVSLVPIGKTILRQVSFKQKK